MTTLIGLTGRARAGKDTVAGILRQHCGFVQLSFAAPMREFICSLLGWSLQDLDRGKETPHPLLDGKTPRFAMQTLGTEWGRNTIANDLWVRVCIAAAQRHLAQGTSVVISDVRFDNEASAVAAAGGQVWRIDRPGERIAESAHISEAGTSLWNRRIPNDGTLDDLRARVLAWVPTVPQRELLP